MKTNKLLDNVQPDAIESYAHKFGQIDGLLSLTMGEPDLNVPDGVKAGVYKALEDNQTHYGDGSGLAELKEAISDYFKARQGLTLNPDQIIITNGVTEGVRIATDTFLNPGDAVLIPSPYFSAYDIAITLAGAKAVYIDTSATGYKLSAEDLKASLDQHPEARLLFLNYPTNPTGTTYSKDEIKALAAVIKDYDIFVVADEIYSDLVYNGQHYSILNELPDQTIYLNGASKSFSMTGFRIGFMYVPAAYFEKVLIVHQANVTCVSTPDQYGALAAYRDCRDYADRSREEYQRRLNLVQPAIKDMGLDMPEASGAFYVFPTVPESYQGDDVQFVLDLAEKAKVGVLPGSIFGEAGKGHFRLSYTLSYDNLEVALERMAVFVKSRQ